MRRLALAAVLALALPAVAGAHPSYQFCGGHHRCTPLRRAYRVKCDGVWWLSPRPVRRPGAWCQNIPAFPSGQLATTEAAR